MGGSAVAAVAQAPAPSSAAISAPAPPPATKLAPNSGGAAAASGVLGAHKKSLATSSLLQERFALIKQLNADYLDYSDLLDLAQAQQPYSLAHYLTRCRHYLFFTITADLFTAAVSRTQVSASDFELVLSRFKAAKYIALNECDIDGRWSVFGQAFRAIHGRPPASLRHTGQHWKVIFAGERAQDAGGPYRESWSVMCGELQSPHVPLLKQCPNARSLVGFHQDAWVLNPDATSSDQLQMFEFLGE